MSIFDNFFPSKNRDFFSEFFQFSSVFGQGYITESELDYKYEFYTFVLYHNHHKILGGG